MTFTYDGTFEGLLSVIFETYRLKTTATNVIPAEDWQGSLFETPLMVATKKEWAERVKAGIKKKGGKKSLRLVEHCFLSELPEVGKLIYDFVRKLMASSIDISDNFGDDTVLQLHQIKKKIGREVHRMHAFVRFQRTQDDIYYAVIEPDFNVLPLLPDHFEKRYPAQQWLIYDVRRRYGIYYDQHKTEFVSFANDQALQYRQLPADMMAEQEVEYQVLWKSYFDSVNIKERKNPKLHLQHVPRRYWKYLSEKREQFQDPKDQ
jgi:probable DNA metabolism protein